MAHFTKDGISFTMYLTTLGTAPHYVLTTLPL
jgi:hypothetical protein